MKAIKYKCRTCGKGWDTYQSGRMKYKTIFNTIDNCEKIYGQKNCKTKGANK